MKNNLWLLISIFCSPLYGVIQKIAITDKSFELLKPSLAQFHSESRAYASKVSEPNHYPSVERLKSKLPSIALFLARFTLADSSTCYCTFENDNDINQFIKQKDTWRTIHWYYLKTDFLHYCKNGLHKNLLLVRDKDGLVVIDQKSSLLVSKY